MKKSLKLKKIISIILVCGSISIFQGCTSIQGNFNKSAEFNLYKTENNKNEDKNRVLNYDEVKDSLIRFHVIANSDDE